MAFTFVNDHGDWTAYVPSPWPLQYPQNALFTKRDNDAASGIGWYAYVYSDPPNFAATSIKLVLRQVAGAWTVQAASRSADYLFPQAGAKVVEFDDGATTPFDPWAYNGYVYDATAKTLTPPAA